MIHIIADCNLHQRLWISINFVLNVAITFWNFPYRISGSASEAPSTVQKAREKQKQNTCGKRTGKVKNRFHKGRETGVSRDRERCVATQRESSPRDFLPRAAESGPIPSIFLAAATTGLQKLPSIRPGLGKRGWGSGRRRGGSWRLWTGSARPTRRTATSSRSPLSSSSSLPSASSSTASSSRCACACRLSFFLPLFRSRFLTLSWRRQRQRVVVACCRETRLNFCWIS